MLDVPVLPTIPFGRSVIHRDFPGTIYITDETYIFVAADQENDSNAITWIDTQSNIQFTVQAQMSTDDLVHMAESVSLVETTK